MCLAHAVNRWSMLIKAMFYSKHVWLESLQQLDIRRLALTTLYGAAIISEFMVIFQTSCHPSA